ncbi:MAG: hypothetical protein AAF362_18520, partial [Pseudomonadota bacterium]
MARSHKSASSDIVMDVCEPGNLAGEAVRGGAERAAASDAAVSSGKKTRSETDNRPATGLGRLFRDMTRSSIALLILAVLMSLLAFFLIFYGSSGGYAFLAVSAFLLAMAGMIRAHAASTGYRKEALRLPGALEELEDKTWELRERAERYRSMAEAFGDLVMHR